MGSLLSFLRDLMKLRFRQLCLLGLIPLLGCAPLFSQTTILSHIGVGLNYGGGQLDWRSSSKWMFELRAQEGSDKDNGLETRSSLAGLRIYRFLHDEKSFTPLFGWEMAAVRANQKTTSYDASGFSTGLFGGLGLKLARPLLLELDAGPYVIQLKEKRTKADKTSIDLVGDASLIFFF